MGRSRYMSQLLEKLAAEDRLTADQVRRIGVNVADLVKRAKIDPEFRREALEKLGLSLEPTAGTILKLMGTGALLTAGVTGASKAADLISNKIRERNTSIQKARAYKGMMDANPELSSPGVNAKMVQRHFDTLHRFNPDYASDPVVAGGIVRNSLQSAVPNIDALNNLVKARQSIVSTNKAQMVDHGAEAAKSLARGADRILGMAGAGGEGG
jgi:hypothetical protein